MPASARRHARRTRPVARRWTDGRGRLHTDCLATTLLELGADGVARLYDGRGGMEADIKGGKRGAGVEKRRKRSFHAQEALALLSQLAHNRVVWLKRRFLEGTAAARLVRDVLAMPAQVRVGYGARKVRLKPPNLHPWAKAVAHGGEARCPRDGWRTIWRKI